MASIPRKRKNEILKMYYDGDTVGRAAVNRYLDMQRNTTPKITSDELIFLKENFTEYDNQVYRGYAKLTETFSTIGQLIWGWGEAFSHAFYRILYFVDPAISFINSFSHNKDFFSVQLEQACNLKLSFLKRDMPFVWSILKRSTIFIYRYNLVMQELGKASNFDVEFLCYDSLQLEIDFNSLISNILMLRQAISFYKNQQGKKIPPKTQVVIPDEIENLLEDITRVRIDDLKPTKEVQNSLLNIFSKVPNIFPSVINCDFLDIVIRHELLNNI